MRINQLVLFAAIAVLGCAIGAQAAPVITPLGNYDLLPDTPGQTIPLYISGIVPNSSPTLTPPLPGNVNGMVLSVAINDGGPAFGGGLLGPQITFIDVDSGPTIWAVPNSPFGHNAANDYYLGQLAGSGFLTTTGWVNVTGGLLATLEIDTTGFFGGTYSLTLAGGYIETDVGDTVILGSEPYVIYDGPPGQITIVPEPSSVVLAAIGLIGLAVWRRKFFFPTH